MDREVGGEPSPRQQAGVRQHGRGGADGSDGFALTDVCLREVGRAAIGAEGLHAGTAGDEQQIELLVDDFVEGGIGLHGDLAPAGHEFVAEDRGDDNVRTGASKEVDGSERLDFFETGDEEAEGFLGHSGGSVARSRVCGKGRHPTSGTETFNVRIEEQRQRDTTKEGDKDSTRLRTVFAEENRGWRVGTGLKSKADFDAVRDGVWRLSLLLWEQPAT